ncbi:MAG: hypothetical protein R3C19_15070 [Planctomycetaceae bacterium]
MQHFDYRFTVDAPVDAVASFHFQPDAFRKLTPPLTIVKMHRAEPPSDGSVTEFTMWIGPFPIYWKAVHSSVSPSGFTDTQDAGPMKFWRHTHRFAAITPATTEVHEHIEYQHHDGWMGLRSRLLFSRPALRALFAIRKFRTRRALRK